MSPNGASFAFGAPPRTAPGTSRRKSANVGALPLTTRLADDVRRRQRAVALDRRVEVAGPGEERARRGLVVDAERRRAARDERVAVGDVVEKPAGEVGVAVAVHVAVGRRRALRDRLLVGERVVVVQVDVDRVVDARRVRIGDEERGPLAVELRAGGRPDGCRGGRRPTSTTSSGSGTGDRSSRPAREMFRDGPRRVANFTEHVAGLPARRRAGRSRRPRVPRQALVDEVRGQQQHERVVRIERLRPAVPAGIRARPSTSATCSAGRDGRSRCRRRGRLRCTPAPV